jgi:hypothetical protein
MSVRFKLRPEWSIDLEDAPPAVIEKLDQVYRRSANDGHFRMYGDYGELHLPVREHRLWSPQLAFSIDELDSRSRIRGRFSPRTDIRAVVWILYLLMLFTAFYGAALAYSQWTAKIPMWGLWAMGGSLTVYASIWVTALTGQHWSTDQMEFLRGRLLEVLDEAGIRRAGSPPSRARPVEQRPLA